MTENNSRVRQKNVLLEREDKPVKGGGGWMGGARGCHCFITLLFNHIYCVLGGEIRFPLLLFGSLVFWVSHARFWSKFLFYWNLISFVHFWSIMVVYKKCWLLYLILFEIHRKINGQLFLSAQARCFLVLKRFKKSEVRTNLKCTVLLFSSTFLKKRCHIFIEL